MHIAILCSAALAGVVFGGLHRRGRGIVALLDFQAHNEVSEGGERLHQHSRRSGRAERYLLADQPGAAAGHGEEKQAAQPGKQTAK